MATIKPSLARGTRDFGPDLMAKRKYIFGIIESVFRLYGYQPLETPAMESLQTLTGKYGEEGDRLIFKILNSGDYFKDIQSTQLDEAVATQSRSLTPLISEKALRYDLTVPLARYVAMNRGQLNLPFKRYQIQPVWRADRPQKGRYREFYQCDVDVIGSASLFNEAELIAIYVTVFQQLGFKAFTVRINNRKFFAGLAAYVGLAEQVGSFVVTLDKLDKIGAEAVEQELLALGAKAKELAEVLTLLQLKERAALVKGLEGFSADAGVALGLQEMQQLFAHLELLGLSQAHVAFDLTLARGLDYYTGTIMEVVTHEVAMGSIGGGGRYDNLTGIFGVDGLTGVGVSFGAERILDVMEQLSLFPDTVVQSSKILLFTFSEKEMPYAIQLLKTLRTAGIAAEWYAEGGKMKKAFTYAEGKHIPYLAILGEDEVQQQTISLKNIQTGEQRSVRHNALLDLLKD
ncbi:MAG: histidine--tRNA ligase [Sphingobacteriaceae bacterium]|nr:histidine--tRNA ligase [Sphingobacteriaceae bacterium]